jgi:hypothetical protein
VVFVNFYPPDENDSSSLTIAGLVVAAVVAILFFESIIAPLFSGLSNALTTSLNEIQQLDFNGTANLGGHVTVIQSLANQTASFGNALASNALPNEFVIAALIGAGLALFGLSARWRRQ